MIFFLSKYIKDINKIYSYIISNKFKKVEYYNCMSELLLLLKNTFRELTDIYNKYVLIPKLKKSI